MLLVAIVAAIALTLRKRKDTQAHRPGPTRCRVKRSDRLRIVKMKSDDRVAPAPPPRLPRRRRQTTRRAQ